MRKSSITFHSKRASGRAVRYNGRLVDYCAETHGNVNSVQWQLFSNTLLYKLLGRAGV